MPKTLHPYYLQQMGIETWVIRKNKAQTMKLMVICDDLDTGGLFSKMMNSIGLAVEDVCTKSCLSSTILEEITLNPPQLLLALGDTAIPSLLNHSQPLNTLRSKLHDYHGTPLIFSYHPVHLLTNPIDKKNAYQDLLLVQQILTQSTC